MTFVDGLGIGDVGGEVLRDRRKLAGDGVVVVVVTVDSQSGELVSGPDIVNRGFVYEEASQYILDEARERVVRLDRGVGAGARRRYLGAPAGHPAGARSLLQRGDPAQAGDPAGRHGGLSDRQPDAGRAFGSLHRPPHPSDLRAYGDENFPVAAYVVAPCVQACIRSFHRQARKPAPKKKPAVQEAPEGVHPPDPVAACTRCGRDRTRGARRARGPFGMVRRRRPGRARPHHGAPRARSASPRSCSRWSVSSGASCWCATGRPKRGSACSSASWCYAGLAGRPVDRSWATPARSRRSTARAMPRGSRRLAGSWAPSPRIRSSQVVSAGRRVHDRSGAGRASGCSSSPARRSPRWVASSPRSRLPVRG